MYSLNTYVWSGPVLSLSNGASAGRSEHAAPGLRCAHPSPGPALVRATPARSLEGPTAPEQGALTLLPLQPAHPQLQAGTRPCVLSPPPPRSACLAAPGSFHRLCLAPPSSPGPSLPRSAARPLRGPPDLGPFRGFLCTPKARPLVIGLMPASPIRLTR